MKKIILASNSPRRKELLEQIGVSFTVVGADCDEVIDPKLPIERAIEQVAYGKAAEVAQKYPDDIIIGADTIVYLNSAVLGKPHSKEHAAAMLKELSGKHHQVITGVAIISAQKQMCFHCISDVTFFDLTEKDIQTYVDSGEPMDKAGAYGIQGKGAVFVAKIVGDYYNIVGLPIAEVARRLKTFETD